jgi:hypothetical protein
MASVLVSSWLMTVMLTTCIGSAKRQGIWMIMLCDDACVVD